jgi:hypothetical protein
MDRIAVNQYNAVARNRKDDPMDPWIGFYVCS